jgi:hypothetical protein
MPAPRSQHASLVDSLQLILQDERRSPDLTRVPSTVLLAAMTRKDELADALCSHPTPALFEEYDSVVDHLGTLATFRAKKIAGSVGYGRPNNMLPQEAAYYDALQAATNELMQVWGVE